MIRDKDEWRSQFFGHLDELGLVEDDLVIASIFERFPYSYEAEMHMRNQSDRWRQEYLQFGVLQTDGSLVYPNKPVTPTRA